MANELGQRPVTTQTGEMLHIDIFSTDEKYFLTCIDKFSKFAVVQPIASRTIEDTRPPLNGPQGQPPLTSTN